MPTKEMKHDIIIGTHAGQPGAWIPVIIPTLKTLWANYFSTVSENQAMPNFNHWLALLHVAATAPRKIPHYLAQLLATPQSSNELQHRWDILTRLFALTAEAIQTAGDQLDSTTWQSWLEIQSRILKSAAQSFPVRDDQPDPADNLQRQTHYLQIINALHRVAVAAHHPDKALDEVIALVQQHFNYEYVNLFLLNQTRQALILQGACWKNNSPKKGSLSFGLDERNIVAQVAATGQAMLVNDVSHSPDPFSDAIKAQMAAPLNIDRNLIGVLEVAGEQINVFSAADFQLLQALADHIALIIKDVHTQTTLQSRLRQQALLLESNITLGANMDLEGVLRLIPQKIVEALHAGACVICQVDEKNSVSIALAEYVAEAAGNPAHTWRKLKTPLPISQDPFSRQMLGSTRPIIGRADPKKVKKPLGWQTPQGQAESEARWYVVLALPLKSEDQLMGLIEIYDQNPNRTFSADDLYVGQALATQTKLALERDETRQSLKEMSTLYTMAQKISGNLQLESVLDTIVTSLREVTGCRGCCIFLIDHNDQSLEIKAASGLKPHWRKMAKLRLGEGIAGRAAAEARTIYLPDTGQDPDFIFFDDEVRSLMAAPLLAKGEVIGVINVDHSRPHAFGPAQERLLTIAAAQVGVAIDNARLFARIAAEQQQTQAIIQYMADGLLLIDGRGVIVTCNRALAMMLGLSPAQIVGRKVDAPDLPPNVAAITALTTHRARTGVLSREVTLETPRPRTLQIFSTTVVEDSGKPIGEVRVVHDVTKERELEQMKDDFMSTVSHELRTPLFSLQGFVEMMLEDDNLDVATRREFLTIVQTQAIQLSDMVNNLLDLSRFDEGKLELQRKPVDILPLIRQSVLKLQGFAHQRQINLGTNLPPALPTLIGDSQRLEQVLTNLVGNAIKFTNSGGQVRVMASVTKDGLLVEVKDSGIGISPEALSRIFSRYYQVENNSERSAMGSGLGLHIAQRIVEGHGGRIWAESESGQGSSFCFTLPLPAPTQRGSEPA